MDKGEGEREGERGSRPVGTAASDEALARRVASAGDDGALAALYDRYGGMVYAMGLRLLGDRSLAEDLVQDVFVSVWRKAATFDPAKASFTTWLHRMARNRATDLDRRRRARPRTAREEPLVFIPGGGGTTEGVAQRLDVAEALSSLSPTHQEVLVLAYFEGLTQKEIALATGTPLGTVKTRTTAALRALSGIMAHEWGTARVTEHRHPEELLGPYVLGELGPEETQEFKWHLEGCPDCREELEALRLAHRAMAAASAPPPPELKARVVGDPPRRSRRGSRTGALAAAAVLVVLFLGALYAGILAPSATVASAPLSPTGLAPGASGVVNLEGGSADNARVRLEVSGLPELRPDEYYELWFVREDGQRISGGGFTVDREGRANVGLNAPSAARGYPGVGITLEESPGDPRPSPDKVLGGELRET